MDWSPKPAAKAHPGFESQASMPIFERGDCLLMLFKDLPAGMFRRPNGLVYTKLAEPLFAALKEEELAPEEYNAVSITGGKPIKIEDEEECIEW